MSHVVRTWNTWVGMPSAIVGAVIRRHPDVDIWFFQEAHRRRKTLSKVPGYTLYMPVGLPGMSRGDRIAAGGCPILVRNELDQRPLPPERLKKRWRRRRMPGIHPPRTLTRVWVEGIEYVNGHAPEHFGHAVPARIEFMGALRALFADGVARVVGGDMNGKSNEFGADFPGGVIEDHDLKVGDARPRRIDFFMGQGVTFAGTAAAKSTEGSDHRAVQTTVTPTSEEPPMPWRVATSLQVLHAEINEAAPNRSKVSDGSIGDSAHASRSSDHNPWIIKRGFGIVRARDWTHDPAGGLDCQALADNLAELLRLGTHPALRTGAYVIWREEIISRDRIAEGWRPYSGSNPHTKHLHLSVTTDPDGFDSTQHWGVMDVITEEDKEDIANRAVAKLLAFPVDVLGDDGDEKLALLQILRQTHNRAGKALDEA